MRLDGGQPPTGLLSGIHSREPRRPALPPSPGPLLGHGNESSLSFPTVAPWPALGQRADRTHAPAAHLVGHPGPSGMRLRWRSDVDASFTRGGFRLANDSLVVPASGMYFVYFQASFLGAACPAGDEPLVLVHRVLLFSDTYPRDVPILSAHKTACPGGGPWYRSLHQGAAFALQKGDRLSTQTEGEAHLLAGQGTLSFGAFAL
ncbi:lymphotoxin-alpha [Chelonoidis abingdonii]|uniref:lymphotoxin-alpha n=1 Tax=Chelonoidis abingdonii TaxID=106734 RepID=UPI003F496D75